MIYQFDTGDPNEATAALLLYVMWRSRGSVKINPKIWGQVEGWVKASAKRAENLPQFLESLKPRLRVDTLSPRWMQAGILGLDAETLSGQRLFLTDVLSLCDSERVLTLLYRETVLVVLLVRDRLEREKPQDVRARALDTEDIDVEYSLDRDL